MSTEQPEHDPSKLVTTWQDVEGLIRERTMPKWLGRALVGITAMLLIVCVVLGVVAAQENILVERVQQAGIAQCESGNSYKSSQTAIWEDLFKLSFEASPPNKNSKAYKLDEEFLHFILMTNAPRDCSQAFFGKADGSLRELAGVNR